MYLIYLKKNILCILFFICFFVIISCTDNNKGCFIDKITKASLVCDNPRYNFRKVNKANNKKVEFSFIIKNTSTKKIKIEAIDISCNCTHLEKTETLVYPNKKFVIHGYVDISKQTGHFSKPIFVKYDDGKILLLRIIGDIVQ